MSKFIRAHGKISILVIVGVMAMMLATLSNPLSAAAWVDEDWCDRWERGETYMDEDTYMESNRWLCDDEGGSESGEEWMCRQLHAEGFTCQSDVDFGDGTGEGSGGSEGGSDSGSGTGDGSVGNESDSGSGDGRGTTQTVTPVNPQLPPERPRIATAANERTDGAVGQSYDKKPSWFYSPNQMLSRWEKVSEPGVPEGEGKVNWGETHTCNIFVYDSLFKAGYTPPLNDVDHYYSAEATHNLRGRLGNFLIQIDQAEVHPGDIATIRWPGGDVHHIEIVSTTPGNDGRFNGLGSHEDGAYPTGRDADDGWRFFRVR